MVIDPSVGGFIVIEAIGVHLDHFSLSSNDQKIKEGGKHAGKKGGP